MNPYESNASSFVGRASSLNSLGKVLLSLGYFCLTPAILHSLLIISGMMKFGFEDGFSIPLRMWWPLGMVVSLVVFLVLSAMMTWPRRRLLMYVSGAATVFFAMIHDTFIAVDLDAYDGNCGNPVMALLMLRFACFSTLAGVPLISLAGVVGLSFGKRGQPADEPIGL